MKKNRVIYIVILVLSVLMTFGITYKFRYKIENSINDIKYNLKVGRKIHKNSNLINKLDSIEDEENAWYTKYHFISHSGGGIDGKLYSNSMEAWNLSYQNGNRLFDADLMLTEDNRVVLRHELSDNIEINEVSIKDSSVYLNRFNLVQYSIDQGNVSYDKYMKNKIYNKYSPMDLNKMLNFMKEHEDVYVLIDAKDNLETIYNDIIENSNEIDKNLLDRIIPSLYTYSDYYNIMNLHNFKNIVMRQYVNNNLNYYELASFMIENKIHVLNVDIQHMNDEEIEKLKKIGIRVYVAVIDYQSDMNYLFDKGYNGAVTNWLYENDFNI